MNNTGTNVLPLMAFYTGLLFLLIYSFNTEFP